MNTSKFTKNTWTRAEFDQQIRRIEEVKNKYGEYWIINVDYFYDKAYYSLLDALEEYRMNYAPHLTDADIEEAFLEWGTYTISKEYTGPGVLHTGAMRENSNI